MSCIVKELIFSSHLWLMEKIEVRVTLSILILLGESLLIFCILMFSIYVNNF